MKTINKLMLLCAFSLTSLITLPAMAADYVIDTEGMHAFVQFRVKHLGYSWLYGRFDDFSGKFTYDEKNPEKNGVSVTVDTASVNTNHAERDKHIRGKDFLEVEKYPQAKFVSTKYEKTGEVTGELTGDLTLHGKTQPVTIAVTHIGGGKDPWGGFRDGFEGRATIEPADFGIPMAEKLGPVSAEVELILTVEGVRQ
jgi:polyisoprenoid-binding protein YceI